MMLPIRGLSFVFRRGHALRPGHVFSLTHPPLENSPQPRITPDEPSIHLHSPLRILDSLLMLPHRAPRRRTVRVVHGVRGVQRDRLRVLFERRAVLFGGDEGVAGGFEGFGAVFVGGGGVGGGGLLLGGDGDGGGGGDGGFHLFALGFKVPIPNTLQPVGTTGAILARIFRGIRINAERVGEALLCDLEGLEGVFWDRVVGFRGAEEGDAVRGAEGTRAASSTVNEQTSSTNKTHVSDGHSVKESNVHVEHELFLLIYLGHGGRCGGDVGCRRTR